VYNDLARQLGATLMDEDHPIEERHVRIDHRGQTDVRGLFAIGDMAKRPDEPVMKQVYTCQEYAVRAVDTVDRRRRSRERRRILGQT
jgi:thioredoxin reductase